MEQPFREFALEHPELCAPKAWIEDNGFLSRIGIEIPGKKDFPAGFLKYFPHDFIVEEIATDGTQYTIDFEPDQQINTESSTTDTIYVTLVKYGLSTFEAVRLLAEQMGCDEKQIQHAGIKDQRAVTAQRLSIRGVNLQTVHQVSAPQFFIKDIEVGKGALQPGSLWGNRFTILIRTTPEVHATENIALLTKQLQHVLENGFYNFFYLQRFGAPRYINYRWGKSLVQGDFEGVIQSFLYDTADTELQYFSALRKVLRPLHGDWSAMQQYIDATVPDDVFTLERKFINYLSQNPDDYLGALRTEEKQVQLWVYAFGSRLFNKQLSYILAQQKVPPTTLPIVLSNERADTDKYKYKYLLQQENVWPPRWPGLREFPSIRRRSQTIDTTSAVQVEAVDVVESGIVLKFLLQKGEYATTFLSHLFNLLGGVMEQHNLELSDANEMVWSPSAKRYFQPVIDEQMEYKRKAPAADAAGAIGN